MNDTTFQGNGKITYVPVVVNAKPPKQTNADRIRAKTDEELAKTMNSTGDCPPRECPYAYADLSENGGNLTDKQCVECWIEWLKQEVEDERASRT